MFYKNTSTSAKTFHRVTFKPGETKEVGDYINSSTMILVDRSRVAEKPTEVPNDITEQKKPSSEIVGETVLVDEVSPEKEVTTPNKKSNKEKSSNKEQESN